ncbi:MAG: hypothetical protein HeimC2_22890 [Candidatus Heimdallarchaeota archaeon LC_2]|nr:MAG: hypothetical protein HeimC2_22890 [Candidatus Heimdallarchaeota archaeon LC_2]
MATSSVALEFDNYGHLSLISLFVAAFVYILNFENVAIFIAVLSGMGLIILYANRIRNIPIHIRTPLSDSIIAMGALTSIIYLFRQFFDASKDIIPSIYTPGLAIGFLIIGTFLKLVLFEEGVKQLVNYSIGRTVSIFAWVVSSRKNTFRIILLVLGILLFVFKDNFDEISEDRIGTTMSLVSFSFLILLDSRNVGELRKSRRFISFPLSIILLTRGYSVPEDSLSIGGYFLAFSLIMTSINFKAIYLNFITILQLIKHSIIYFLTILRLQIFFLIQFVKSNTVIITRVVSVIFGFILLITPSSYTIDLIFIAPKINNFLGSLLIIIPLLPNINRFRLIIIAIWIPFILGYVVNSYIQLKLKIHLLNNWIIFHRLIISRFTLFIAAILEIIIGPKEKSLNFIIGFFLLVIVFWPTVHKIIDRTVKFVVYVYQNYIINFSNSSGYLGLTMLIYSLFIQNRIISISLILGSSILLSYAWNNGIFRFLDTILGFLVSVIVTIQNILYRVITYFFRDSPVSKIFNALSVILFFVAIFGISPIDQFYTFIISIIMWNSAYPYRRNRISNFAVSFVNGTIIFIKSFFIGVKNFLIRAGISIWFFVKKTLHGLYANLLLIGAWIITTFFIILSFGLIFSNFTDISEIVFGDNIIDDDLISVIIAFTLLSASVLTIQQTYLNREVLKIGADNK